MTDPTPRQAFEAYMASEGYAKSTCEISGSAFERMTGLAQQNAKLPARLLHHAQRVNRWLQSTSPRSALARWLKVELDGKTVPEAAPKRSRGIPEALSQETWAKLRQLVVADSSIEALVLKVLMGTTLRFGTAIDQPIGMLEHALVAADASFLNRIKSELRQLPQTSTLHKVMTDIPGSRSPYVRVYNLLSKYGEVIGESLTLNAITKTPPGRRQGKMR
jgi:hypothetical protein